MGVSFGIEASHQIFIHLLHVVCHVDCGGGCSWKEESAFDGQALKHFTFHDDGEDLNYDGLNSLPMAAVSRRSVLAKAALRS